MIGLLNDGILLVEPDGRIVTNYAAKIDLRDRSVYHLHVDRDGSLWAALSNGIAVIHPERNLRTYTSIDGLDGTVFSLSLDGDRVYAGTSLYTYALNRKGDISAVPGTRVQTWDILTARGETLLAHNPGGFLRLDASGSAVPLAGNTTVVASELVALPGRADHLLGGGHDGLHHLRHNGTTWEVAGPVRGFDHAVYSMTAAADGTLWVRTAPDDLYRVRLSADFRQATVLTHLPSERRPPGSSIISPYPLNDGRVVFGSSSGVYAYDERGDSLTRFPPLAHLRHGVNPVFQDRRGRIWYEESTPGHYRKGVLATDGTDVTGLNAALRRLDGMEIYDGPLGTIREDAAGQLYFATSRGVAVLNPTERDATPATAPVCLLRRVSYGDSLVYGGGERPQDPNLSFAYGNEGPRITFSCPSFELTERTDYSYRLVGYDGEWSDWEPSNQRDYSNLREGSYVFEVRARTYDGRVSQPARVPFSVTPPYYRTGLAYGLYALAALLGIAALAYLLNANLRRRNVKLEKIVAERTRELLEERDVSAALSDNLLHVFQIVSHDLRGPVLSFRGITEKVNYLLRREDYARLSRLGPDIERKAASLYRLTDNLLNWALANKDSLPHRPVRSPLHQIVAESVDPFIGIAEQANVNLTVDVPTDLYVYADTQALSSVLRNLLDNALRFTPAAGRVAVTAESAGDVGGTTIRVSDTGPGIDDDQIAALHAVGYAAPSQAGGRNWHGTGLGLRLVMMIVARHGGRVTFSRRGAGGTCVEIWLPGGVEGGLEEL